MDKLKDDKQNEQQEPQEQSYEPWVDDISGYQAEMDEAMLWGF